MAVVVVFWPMYVFSTSTAAKRASEGIRHRVVEMTDKPIWDGGEMLSIDGCRTACGSVIGYTLLDNGDRAGRPVRMCVKCESSRQDPVELIGIHAAGWGGVPELLSGSGQGSLLT